MHINKEFKCPLCKGYNTELICNSDGYNFRKCLDCGLLYLSNHPTKGYFKKFYSYSDENKYNKQIRKINPLLSILLKNPLSLKIISMWGDYVNENWASSVERLKSEGSILDVGCGPAVLLEKLHSNGWKVTGVEVGDKLVRQASQKIGKENVYKGELPKLYKKFKDKFDVVSFWHVLEHLSDFESYIKSASKLLKKGGILIIEVPHADSINLSLFKKHWTFLMPPQHLHFWTRDTLYKLVKEGGLKTLKIEYPNYFAFSFNSSFVKRYPKSIFLTPLIIPVSVVVSIVFSLLRKGDVIRIYAQK